MKRATGLKQDGERNRIYKEALEKDASNQPITKFHQPAAIYGTAGAAFASLLVRRVTIHLSLTKP